MEQFINGLTDKVGLDRSTAERVVQFVKDNWSQVPGWIASSGVADKLPGGIGDRLEGMIGSGANDPRKD